ncbi:hypothetical protein GCM10022252_76100 [Streptosporangium oxazolinicum]|uniref:Uncharacterized protein n=1 Tax=Streptosporangium oxazolinicum TaxID=909287 RepID=A0ABP8BLA6_9ACTN
MRRTYLLHGIGWLLATVAIAVPVIFNLSWWSIPIVICAWLGIMSLAQAVLSDY